MVVEDSSNHVHFPVCTQHVCIVSLLRDCLRTLGSPSKDPSASTNEVFLVVIVTFLDTDEYKGEFPFVPAPRLYFGLHSLSSLSLSLSARDRHVGVLAMTVSDIRNIMYLEYDL
jgi:hypothetical protein